MNPRCPCGAPAVSSLAARYRHQRPGNLPEAAGPWNELDLAPVLVCASVACEAQAMLAAVDEMVTDAAFSHGQLLDPENIWITSAARPGEDPAA